MYGHERSLVHRLRDKPFALVGYNVRDELDHIKEVTKDKNLIWRSFFGGNDRTVPTEYAIQGYPTILIIDANGVIRYKDHEPNDELIDELLAEM